MPTVRFVLLVLFLVIGSAASGQDLTGLLEGTATDTTGAVLVGVRLEARLEGSHSTRVTTTDDRGGFRLAGLPPGRYELTARSPAFAPRLVRGLVLGPAERLRVDVSLQPEGLDEHVTVVGAAIRPGSGPAVVANNMTDEELQRLPLARDFTSALDLLPGVTNDARMGGLSVDGASGAESRFVIDGLDTTSLRSGTSGKALPVDFVERVQATVSGFSPEYSSATGGVFTVATRTGTNAFSAGLGGYLTSSALEGRRRPVLRLKPADQTQAEYVYYPDDRWATWEPIFELAGPLRRDRAWFFLGGSRAGTTTSRDVVFTAGGQRRTVERTNDSTGIHAALTAQLTDSLRAKLTLAPDLSRSRGSLPAIQPDGSSTSLPSTDWRRSGFDSWNQAYAASVDYAASPRLAVAAAAGVIQYDTRTTYRPLEPQVVHRGSNYMFAEIPDAYRVQDRHAEGPIQFLSTAADQYRRWQASATATWFGNLRGAHAFKIGIQFQRLENAPVSGYLAPYIQFYWDSSYPLPGGSYARGDYGYYEAMMQQHTGPVHANNVALFAQDAWTVGGRLSITAGVRADRETVPSYRSENRGIEFGFLDRVAPRLGFTLDVLGDGRWKALGAWGRFFDQTKLELARTALGGFRSFSGYYTLDSYDWRSVNCVPWEGNCPGTRLGLMDWAIPANASDPRLQGLGLETALETDLEPMASEEISLGVEHALTARATVTARYVHKRLLRAIEDMGILVPDVGRVLFVANPGVGALGRLAGPSDPGVPKPVRDYDAVELGVRRRFSRWWSFGATYAYTRLFGNYAGLASPDENGRVAPNVTLAFDAAYVAYDAQAKVVLGRMDRPHSLDAHATCDLPLGVGIGVVFRAMSGVPEQKQLSQKGYPVLFEGRGSMHRTPAFSQVDLLLEERLTLGNRHRFTISLNVTNLLDQGTVTRRANTPWRDAFNLTDQEFFAGFDPYAVAAARKLRPNPVYGMDSAWQARRSARVSLKYRF